MKKWAKMIFALYSYLVVAVAMAAFFLFFENVFFEKTVSLPLGKPVTFNAIMGNIGLLVLFGLQHSIMARDWFKSWLYEWVNPALERIIYLLVSAITLALIVHFWQPFGSVIWDVRGSIAGYVLLSWGMMGGFIVVISVGLINSKAFIGWQQIQENKADIAPVFVAPLFYQYVRHPIYFGTLLAFWCVPLLSYSGLLFNVGMTIYIVVGAALEERNLRKRFGNAYRTYQENVPMLIPFTKFRRIS